MVINVSSISATIYIKPCTMSPVRYMWLKVGNVILYILPHKNIYSSSTFNRIIEKEMNMIHDEDRLPELHNIITETQKVVQQREAEKEKKNIKKGKKEYYEVLNIFNKIPTLHIKTVSYSFLALLSSHGEDVQ